MNIKKPSNENGSKIIFSYVPVRALTDGGTIVNPDSHSQVNHPFVPSLKRRGWKIPL